ncbi:hypothetical protein [Halomonas caseinilytica]|uniref:hypothetical protein n=2 Tax=Halomonas caseinilytica TaxID=438744 RepID=UPI0007E56EA8|nr:hypothetical protein [Halomonas caseinilytica]SEN65025.1 hypothetical protein SAMN04487952_12311 [Halomonas caseinilytica]
MPHILFKTDGTPETCVLQQDGQDMNFVTGLTFRQDAEGLSRAEIEYGGAAFQVEHADAEITCVSTGLGEDEERAVLAYLQNKYRE